ncbi:MAG: HEPN domain-containing protein [Anaerolineae bacterium]
MLDIQKQIAYWQNSAVEDWQVAQDLLEQHKVRHSLFFAHLSLEKLLKAIVCHHTQDIAPRLHNLVRLAELTGLSWTEEQIDTLAEMNVFNIEGRYPDHLQAPPLIGEAKQYFQRAEEVYQWLIQQLSNLSGNTSTP